LQLFTIDQVVWESLSGSDQSGIQIKTAFRINGSVVVQTNGDRRNDAINFVVNIGGPTFASQTSADFFGPRTNLGSRKLPRAKITPHFYLQGVQRLIREQTPNPKKLHLPKIFRVFPRINAYQHGAGKDRPTIPLDGSNIAKQATGGWVFSGTETTNQHRRTSTLGVNPRVVQNWRH
jgi:hypothetical protein